jgi:hypothetical protein
MPGVELLCRSRTFIRRRIFRCSQRQFLFVPKTPDWLHKGPKRLAIQPRILFLILDLHIQ